MNQSESTTANRHRKLFIAILLIAISLVAIQVGAYYDLERFFLANNSAAQNTGSHGSNGSENNTSNTDVIRVNTLLNFGNGTSKWFNESRIPVGWNFFNLTVYVANGNVGSTWSTEYHEHFITAIDGIGGGITGVYYWALWQYCNNDHAWLYSHLGADDITLSNNQTMAWYFSDQSNPPPISGAQTTTACP